MSDSTSAQPEPTPFEHMQALATRVLSVPKAEVDKREEEWRRKREEKKRVRKSDLGMKPILVLLLFATAAFAQDIYIHDARRESQSDRDDRAAGRSIDQSYENARNLDARNRAVQQAAQERAARLQEIQLQADLARRNQVEAERRAAQRASPTPTPTNESINRNEEWIRQNFSSQPSSVPPSEKAPTTDELKSLIIQQQKMIEGLKKELDALKAKP